MSRPASIQFQTPFVDDRGQNMYKKWPELKPCPFCGKIPSVHSLYRSLVACKNGNQNCPIYGKFVYVPNWNIRDGK